MAEACGGRRIGGPQGGDDMPGENRLQGGDVFSPMGAETMGLQTQGGGLGEGAGGGVAKRKIRLGHQAEIPGPQGVGGGRGLNPGAVHHPETKVRSLRTTAGAGSLTVMSGAPVTQPESREERKPGSRARPWL